MKITAIGLLTADPSLWAEYVPEVLKFCDEFLAYQYSKCEESAKVVREVGGLIVDEPIDYLQTSDTGTGLTTLAQEARERGADAVYMADPTDKFDGDIAEVEKILSRVEVVKSKLFRARVTEDDEETEVYEHKHFEPEYNHKVTFCTARPGRLFWAMYPYWPYGALSMEEYGTVRSYALAHSREAYRILTMGISTDNDTIEELTEKAEDWVSHDMKSAEGNPLITNEEFGTKGVELCKI